MTGEKSVTIDWDAIRETRAKRHVGEEQARKKKLADDMAEAKARADRRDRGEPEPVNPDQLRADVDELQAALDGVKAKLAAAEAPPAEAAPAEAKE